MLIDVDSRYKTDGKKWVVSIRNTSFINLASPVATSRSPKGWQTVGALWAQGAIAKEEGGGVLYMGVSKSRGTPKWMVYDGKPYENG